MSDRARSVALLAAVAIAILLLAIGREAPRSAGPPARDSAGSEATALPPAPLVSPSATPAAAATPIPVLERGDLYRAIVEAGDVEPARRAAAILRSALGASGLEIVIGDFVRALEEEDRIAIAGCAFVIAEAASGAEPELDDLALLDTLDLLAVSEAAADAIAAIHHHAGRCADVHAERLVELVRAGLPDDHRLASARALLLLHAALHSRAEFFLPLLDDELPFLRRVAAAALARIDPARHAERILDAVGRRADDERTSAVLALAAALPPDAAAETISALYDRWPDARLTEPWIEVGRRDCEAIIRVFRREDDPTVRRRMLVGWHSDGLEPGLAERFLSEVLDLDPDPRVRSQALLALGQIDDPNARARLAEAARGEGDSRWEAHLSGGILNALSHAPAEWVDEVAIPFALRRIAASGDPDHSRREWIDALRESHPDRVRALDEP